MTKLCPVCQRPVRPLPEPETLRIGPWKRRKATIYGTSEYNAMTNCGLVNVSMEEDETWSGILPLLDACCGRCPTTEGHKTANEAKQAAETTLRQLLAAQWSKADACHE